jgi:hypothetical protein
VYDLIVFRGYNEVVHIDFQPTLCDLFSEDVIYHCLKGCRGVGESKEHDYWFEEPFTHFEGCFPFVSLFDLDIVVAPLYVKFQEQLVSHKIVDKVINKGKGILIGYHPFV